MIMCYNDRMVFLSVIIMDFYVSVKKLNEICGILKNVQSRIFVL